MPTRARDAAGLLAGDGQPPVARRRTDTMMLWALLVALAAGAVAAFATGATTLEGAGCGQNLTIAAAVFLAAAWKAGPGRVRAVCLGLTAAALVVIVLILPIYPTQAVGILALIYCAMTLHEDVVAWVVTLVGSTVTTLVGAAVDPTLVFGPGHRHQHETVGSLAGHLLMFVLAATASGVAWVVVLRARAAERDAMLAERAVEMLLPALSGSAPISAFAADGERPSERAVEQVKALSMRGRQLLDGLEEVVIEVGPDGRVEYANPAAGVLWGRQASDLRGQDAGALLLLPWPTLRDMAQSRVAARTTAVCTTGQRVPVQATVVPLFAGAHEAGFVITVINLTDRLAAQEAALERERLLTQRQYALELNDTVVQGLTVAVYAQEVGEEGEAATMLRETLARAREMVSALLDDGAPLDAATLRRLTPANPMQDSTSDPVWTGASGPEERLF